jgi:Ulp1 family protease
MSKLYIERGVLDLSAVAGFTRKAKHAKGSTPCRTSYANAEWIIMPVNYPKLHWGLLLMSMKLECVFYLNAAIPSSEITELQDNLPGALDDVRAWLADQQQQFKLRWTFALPPQSWPLHFLGGGCVPQQEDQCNCGVFTVMYALSAIFGVPFAQLVPDNSATALQQLRSKLLLLILKQRLINLNV